MFEDVAFWEVLPWLLLALTWGIVYYLIKGGHVSKEQLTKLMDAFWETKPVQDLKDAAWDEIKDKAEDKLSGTAAWDYFEEWFDEDDDDVGDDEEELSDTDGDEEE